MGNRACATALFVVAVRKSFLFIFSLVCQISESGSVAIRVARAAMLQCGAETHGIVAIRKCFLVCCERVNSIFNI
jgi:hypothetical protein